MLMYVFVRILYSQALRLVPSRNPPKPRYARRYVSWTRSSASVGLRVMRNAAAYSADMKGIASSANCAWSAMEGRVPAPSKCDRPGAAGRKHSADVGRELHDVRARAEPARRSCG